MGRTEEKAMNGFEKPHERIFGYTDAGQSWEGERIIRCRDCQFGYQHDCKRYPKDKKYMGKWYCIVWGDGMQGEWTRADGFCHRVKLRGES